MIERFDRMVVKPKLPFFNWRSVFLECIWWSCVSSSSYCIALVNESGGDNPEARPRRSTESFFCKWTAKCFGMTCHKSVLGTLPSNLYFFELARCVVDDCLAFWFDSIHLAPLPSIHKLLAFASPTLYRKQFDAWVSMSIVCSTISFLHSQLNIKQWWLELYELIKLDNTNSAARNRI